MFIRPLLPIPLRFLGLAWLLAASPAFAADAGLGEIMDALAQVQSSEATFTERRHVAQIDHVLESSGRLSYAAPDTFVRETLKPRRDRLAVVGNVLTMSQGSRSRTVPLDAQPEAQVIVEAIRGTLTGNRELIERHFSTTVNGPLTGWTLQLVPKDARLRGQVAQIKVMGRQSVLSEVQVLLADGDRSVMQIQPAASAAR